MLQGIGEFVEHDLCRAAGTASFGDGRACHRFLEWLVLLAVEREELVTVSYRWSRLGVASEEMLMRAIVLRIWEEEVYHHSFLTAIHHAEFRRQVWLRTLKGRLGGELSANAVTSSQPVRVPPIISDARKLLFRGSIKLGELSGDIPPAIGYAMRGRLTTSRFCSINAALELTAYLAYKVMAHLVYSLGESRSTTVEPHYLGMKLMEIATQELRHAFIFSELANVYAATESSRPAEPDRLARLQKMAALVRDSARWPQPPRVSRRSVQKHVLPGKLVSRNVESLLDPVGQMLKPFGAEVDAALVVDHPRPTTICINSGLTIARDGLERGEALLIEVFVWWIAERLIALGLDAELWITGQPSNRSLNAPNSYFLKSLISIQRARPGSTLSSSVVPIVDRHSTPLTTHGTFFTADPDVQHRVAERWAWADLRISSSFVESSADPLILGRLGRVVSSRFDPVIGRDLADAERLWFEAPAMEGLTSLRLLGAYPPDLILTGISPTAGSKNRGTSIVVATDILEADTAAAEACGIDLRKYDAHQIGLLAGGRLSNHGRTGQSPRPR